MMKTLLCLLTATLLLLSSCTSLSVEEAQSKRLALDTMAETAIAGLKAQDPGLEALLDAGLAYGVANMKVTKVPVVGAGGGEGVLVVKESGRRFYFTVARLDVGGGSAGADEGFSMHVLSDGGASATVTARVVRVKINRDLTESP